MNSNYFIKNKNYLPILFISFIIVAIFYSCTVTLISEYDEQTDIAVVELQKKVESLLSEIDRSIGSNNFSYNNFEKKYDEARTDLSSLQIRAKARPKNEIQVQQFDKILNQINLLEEAHKSNEGIGKSEIPTFRNGFNQSFEAVIKLELAKKRGE